MLVQFQNNSLKKVMSLAGAVGVGLTLGTPALAEVSSSARANASVPSAMLIALTPEEQAIINTYKPPATKTYIPEYNIVDLKDVKPFLCTNNSTPECGFEVPQPGDSIPIPRYGVTDNDRKPSSMVCLNSNNPLCENPLNYGREFAQNTGEEFKARTRSLWEELDRSLAQRRPTPDFTPPERPTPPPTATPAPRPAPGPVPGLW
jgi:hypothetical protein